MNYYNEWDKNAAAWIRELIAMGEIPDGEVDERSIKDVSATDLRKFTQVHLFAGVAGWSRALRLAGWPEDRPVFTGSCPCQSYSVAGKQKGNDDERNLWPEMFRLIRESDFESVFMEQVSNAIGHGWLDRVSADLETKNYAVGPLVLGAFSVGAPHRRQRLYIAAKRLSNSEHTERRAEREKFTDSHRRDGSGGSSEPGRLADSASGGFGIDGSAPGSSKHIDERGEVGRLANSEQPGLEGYSGHEHNRNQSGRIGENPTGSITESGIIESAGSWSDFDVLPCRDGKVRRTQRGLFPLAPGLPKGMVHSSDPSAPINPQATSEARVMRLRGYGNSIVPELAAEFIKAFTETL